MRATTDGTASRRDAIREILARHVVENQDALRRHLAARGIRAYSSDPGATDRDPGEDATTTGGGNADR